MDEDRVLKEYWKSRRLGDVHACASDKHVNFAKAVSCLRLMSIVKVQYILMLCYVIIIIIIIIIIKERRQK